MSLEQTETGDWLFFKSSLDLPPKWKTAPYEMLYKFLAVFTTTIYLHLMNMQILIKAKRGSELDKLVDIVEMMSQQYNNRWWGKNKKQT